MNATKCLIGVIKPLSFLVFWPVLWFIRVCRAEPKYFFEELGCFVSLMLGFFLLGFFIYFPYPWVKDIELYFWMKYIVLGYTILMYSYIPYEFEWYLFPTAPKNPHS